MWTQLPPEKGHTHPTQFLAHVDCGQMAGWMKTPLGTEVDIGPGHIVLDGVPPPAKGAEQPPPFFGPCLLWPRSPISATAELLLYNSLVMDCFRRLLKTYDICLLDTSALSALEVL